MTDRRAMTLVLGLALLAIAGLVTMLAVDGAAADGAGFVLAALPLAVGAWLSRAQRRARGPRGTQKR